MPVAAVARSRVAVVARHATCPSWTLVRPHHVLTASSFRPAVSSLQPAIHATQQRYSSHSPLGSEPAKPIKKITLPTLAKMHARGEPITMLTAHDFPSALVADHAGMEIILVGDSLAMVALGMEDTSEVILEEMLLHCRSVSRAVKGAVTVCLLPELFSGDLLFFCVCHLTRSSLI